jgi:hypothetical protein
MIILNKHNILELNKATIQAHGGNYTPPNNLLNESNLDYLIDAVEAEMFGQALILICMIKLLSIYLVLFVTIFFWMVIKELV